MVRGVREGDGIGDRVAAGRRERAPGGVLRDRLLGGGVERGSSVLVLGPAGAGKSIISMTFLTRAVRRGERAAMFVFDEELGLLIERAKGIGIDLEAMQRKKKLMLMQIDAAELTPGEFSARVREAIEDFGAKFIAIDSMTGYQASMPEERNSPMTLLRPTSSGRRVARPQPVMAPSATATRPSTLGQPLSSSLASPGENDRTTGSLRAPWMITCEVGPGLKKRSARN